MMRPTRPLLVTLAALCAAAALPSVAAAVPTCTFVAGTMTVSAAAGDATVWVGRDQATNQIRFGTAAPGAACLAGLVAATNTNIDTITLAGLSGQAERFVIDLTGGYLEPGATPDTEVGGLSDIEVIGDLGAGVGDALELNGRAAADDIRLTGDAAALRMIVRAAQTDEDVAVAGVEQAIVNGQGSGDAINASGVAPFLGPLSIPLEVNAGAGTDIVNGGSVGDTLRGDPDADTIFGHGGADTILGGTGNDDLLGGQGADTIDGGADTDTIFGGTEGDVISGGTGSDDERGEDGDDRFDQGLVADGADTLTGGPGVDRVSYAARSASVTVTLDNASNDGASGESDLALTEEAQGGAGADVLTGNSGVNRLLGGAGIDTLNGGDSDDALDGRSRRRRRRLLGRARSGGRQHRGELRNGSGSRPGLLRRSRGRDRHRQRGHADRRRRPQPAHRWRR